MAPKIVSGRNKYINIPPLDRDERVSNAARVIVFCLRYYGCTAERIYWALISYGFFDITLNSIAEFIRNENLITHLDELQHEINGRTTHVGNLSTIPTTVIIKYEGGLPVKMEINCSEISDLNRYADVLVPATDGQILCMDVSDAQLLCRAFDTTDYRVLSRPWAGARTFYCP